MIERVTVADCTSYGPSGGELDGLRAVNFIYGANGAGKTTISCVMANPAAFPGCSMHWANHHQMEVFVYNRDFVRENFSESGKLKGIFTLGKPDIDVQNQIAQAKLDSADHLKGIFQLRSTLEGSDGTGGKRADLAKLEDDFRDECWNLKTKHGTKLKDALRGYLNDKKAFKARLLDECEKRPSRPLATLEQLEQRAASLYGDTLMTEATLPAIQGAEFLKWEKDPILSRRILGKTDVDIAAMIQKLGNSDWIQQGVKYLENSEGACPFCQQSVTDTLSKSLAEYFDESFVKDTEALAQLETSYKLEGERLQKSLEQLSIVSARFFDVEKLKTERAIFDARLSVNLQRIRTKVKEPSQLVTLEPLGGVLQAALDLVTAANSQISAHNDRVAKSQRYVRVGGEME